MLLDSPALLSIVSTFVEKWGSFDRTRFFFYFRRNFTLKVYCFQRILDRGRTSDASGCKKDEIYSQFSQIPMNFSISKNWISSKTLRRKQLCKSTTIEWDLFEFLPRNSKFELNSRARRLRSHRLCVARKSIFHFNFNWLFPKLNHRCDDLKRFVCCAVSTSVDCSHSWASAHRSCWNLESFVIFHCEIT